MIEQMRIANLADSTQSAYLFEIERRARHYGTSPADLDAEQLRDWVLKLLDRGLSPSSTNSTLAAFRLRSHVHGRNIYRGLRPILFNLYAEPARWPGSGRRVDAAAIAGHREEIARFARLVGGDEVAFLPCTCWRLLETWRHEGGAEIAAHAAAVRPSRTSFRRTAPTVLWRVAALSRIWRCESGASVSASAWRMRRSGVSGRGAASAVSTGGGAARAPCRGRRVRSSCRRGRGRRGARRS